MGFDEWYLPKKHFLDDCESGYFECYEAGAASRQAEVDDLIELNRLYKIALSQSVNRTSIFVHEKIVALESKLKGKKDE